MIEIQFICTAPSVLKITEPSPTRCSQGTPQGQHGGIGRTLPLKTWCFHLPALPALPIGKEAFSCSASNTHAFVQLFTSGQRMIRTWPLLDARTLLGLLFYLETGQTTAYRYLYKPEGSICDSLNTPPSKH